MYICKTTVIASATGEITGYGFSIEATTSGDAEEIAGALAVSLEMLRQTIASQIVQVAQVDPPPGYAPAQPPAAQAAQEPPAQPGPPRTPDEAEQRFFVRYGEIVGGQDWEAVNRYLRRRSTKPTTVDGWIAVAEAVRDRSRQPTQPARRAYARH